MASIGMRCIRERKGLYHAKAISCLHDALLAVAQGKMTPDQVKDFFWAYNFEQAKFIGGVLVFTELPTSAPPQNTASHTTPRTGDNK